jgi:hypothetical protein
MSPVNRQDRMQLQLRTLQIIVFALAAGSGMFAVIVILQGIDQPWSWNLSVLTLMALALGVIELFLRLIVPPIIVSQGQKKFFASTINWTP